MREIAQCGVVRVLSVCLPFVFVCEGSSEFVRSSELFHPGGMITLHLAKLIFIHKNILHVFLSDIKFIMHKIFISLSSSVLSISCTQSDMIQTAHRSYQTDLAEAFD